MSQQQLVRLQQTLTQQSRDLSSSISLTQANKREEAKGKATVEELSTCPDDTPSYRASGRMFIRESLPELRVQLSSQLKNVEDQIARLEQQTIYLKQQVKSTESEMQEVIRQVYESRSKRQ